MNRKSVIVILKFKAYYPAYEPKIYEFYYERFLLTYRSLQTYTANRLKIKNGQTATIRVSAVPRSGYTKLRLISMPFSHHNGYYRIMHSDAEICGSRLELMFGVKFPNLKALYYKVVSIK